MKVSRHLVRVRVRVRVRARKFLGLDGGPGTWS